MASPTLVRKARKDQGHCGKCYVEIKAGDSYVWFSANRFSGRMIRCTKDDCRFTPADLESNEKRKALMEAAEVASKDLAECDDVDEIKAVLMAYADAVREVAELCRESASNIEEGFGHATEKSEEFEGAADELDSAAEDVEQWEPEVEDAESWWNDNWQGYKEGTQLSDEKPAQDYLNLLRENAQEAIDSVDYSL